MFLLHANISGFLCYGYVKLQMMIQSTQSAGKYRRDIHLKGMIVLQESPFWIMEA